MHSRSALMAVSKENVDEVVSMIKSDMGPRFTTAPGFCAWTGLINLGLGQVFGASFWETKDELEAADHLGRDTRAKVNELVGTENQNYQKWEVLYLDLREMTAHCARSIFITVDEGHYEDLLAMLVYQMGPLYASSPGFCGFTVLVDPARKQLFGHSYWRNEEDRETASEYGRRLRSKVKTIAGIEREDFLLWDVYYYEVPKARVAVKDGWRIEDGSLFRNRSAAAG
ncbi:MAG TPA: hypothetical protein VHX88_19235 [Solirubrobacteraceae bacterium]|jgi:heme-degrading monooxygenase HmoA|nr:hypothetical protein [Solirubrobacteraceae bacterium]